MKVLIIGGVAAGASAAARLRRLSEDAEIIIVERSGYISYANCGLPYYVGGVIENKAALTLQTPESFWSRFRIEARVNTEALSIDRKGKTVHLRDLISKKEYTESYDKLILAPGAEAIVPPFPGIDSKRIYRLRHTEDAFILKEAALKAKKAIVIGGGFIGLETAENLRHMGLEVMIIQLLDHVSNLSFDMAQIIHEEIRKNGIDLHLEEGVKSFEEKDDSISVITDKGSYNADFAVLAIGVRPDSKLAKDAGLETDRRGSIIVSDTMRTSDEDIYAAGDAVSIRNAVSGEMGMIALAGPANKEGRIAADNIAGYDSHYRGASGVSAMKVFSLTAASAGITEENAKRLGLDYDVAITYQADHASYYPGSQMMMLKLVYEKTTGRVLGGEAVGRNGTDKRIDRITMAAAMGMTVEDLVDLDFAYAPPYSSAKDPVNILGYIASNKMKGILEEFRAEDIPSLDPDSSMLVDLRTEEEVRGGMIEGAVNIPLDSLRDSLDKLDRSKTIYVYCRSGQRSYIGYRILKGHGFRAKSLSGGYLMYSYSRH